MAAEIDRLHGLRGSVRGDSEDTVGERMLSTIWVHLVDASCALSVSVSQLLSATRGTSILVSDSSSLSVGLLKSASATATAFAYASMR
jgi:hypothetical protein